MTVKELLNNLNNINPDAWVLIDEHGEIDYMEITEVYPSPGEPLVFLGVKEIVRNDDGSF